MFCAIQLLDESVKICYLSFLFQLQLVILLFCVKPPISEQKGVFSLVQEPNASLKQSLSRQVKQTCFLHAARFICFDFIKVYASLTKTGNFHQSSQVHSSFIQAGPLSNAKGVIHKVNSMQGYNYNICQVFIHQQGLGSSQLATCQMRLTRAGPYTARNILEDSCISWISHANKWMRKKYLLAVNQIQNCFI